MHSRGSVNNNNTPTTTRCVATVFDTRDNCHAFTKPTRTRQQTRRCIPQQTLSCMWRLAVVVGLLHLPVATLAAECFPNKETLQGAVQAYLGTSNADTTLLDKYGHDIETWCTTGITDFSHLFADATTLQDVNLSQWNTSAAITMAGMFQGCTALSQSTGLESWDVSRVTDFSHMFHGCTALQVDLSSWDMSQAVDLSYMFANCDVLDFDASAWKTGRVTSLQHFLDGAEAFSNAMQPTMPWNTASLTDASYAFANTGRFDADLGAWNVQNVQTMVGMFHTAVSFSGKGLDQWQTSDDKLQSLAHAFADTWNFNAPIGHWRTRSVTDLTATFRSATAFNQDLSSWQIQSVMHFEETFHGAHVFNQNLCPWRQQLANNAMAADWDKTFSETACPDTSTPTQEGGLVIGSFCHICDPDDTNNQYKPPDDDHDDSLIYTPPSNEPAEKDQPEARKKPTTLQIFEHDIDVLAMIIAFCSGGALVGWLVRRHMLRQRILRRHMEVYAQVQPYDLDSDSVELTSNAAVLMNGMNGSASNNSADDPWDAPREEGKQPLFV